MASSSSDEAGSVTLIFYKLGEKWYKEPFLNIIAAAAQMSAFTHVELAIGSDSGRNGEMTNVARIFNDKIGMELCARTGRSPHYTYLQIGCSKRQENRMLAFARSCIGKPFSNSAMARSLVWPRQTDNQSFFCAGTFALAHTRACYNSLQFPEFECLTLPPLCLCFPQNSSQEYSSKEDSLTRAPTPEPPRHKAFTSSTRTALRRPRIRIFYASKDARNS